MSDSHPVDLLERLSRTFGAKPARDKLPLLEQLAAVPRVPARDLRRLHATLCFMNAYPDNARVRRAIDKVIGRLRSWTEQLRGGGDAPALVSSGVPGSRNEHGSSYAVLVALAAIAPGCLEIEWDDLEDTMPLQKALGLVVNRAECAGLDDIYSTMAEWADQSRQPSMTDLEHVLSLFEGSSLSDEQRAFAYESCGIPVRYRLRQPGSGLAEIHWPVAKVHYQRGEIPRDRVSLRDTVETPFLDTRPLSRSDGARLVELALRSLCARNLEIYSLTYANPRDARLLDCGRGVQVALIGVLPEFRDALESTFFFLVLKNGVPIAYGPASACVGCCEMGINLFPEFRGGEIRFILPQLMRTLHQVLAVRYFYLTAYGMGDGNPDAIRSGAFWFYRKLGFSVTNPDVEALARSEEERMAEDPRYRSSVRMLHRLKATDAYFDLSGGECQRLDLGAVGIALSGFIAERFDGSRSQAEEQCTERVVGECKLGDVGSWPVARRRALLILAPLFCLCGFEGWTARERSLAARLIRAKGGVSESSCDDLLWRHQNMRRALCELGSRTEEVAV